MSTRGERGAERSGAADQRRIRDRRRVAREGGGSARGRRATDLGEARAVGASDRAAGPPRKRRATSDGREPLVVYLRPEAIKALKMAALELDTTASAIVASAVEGWLRGNERAAKR